MSRKIFGNVHGVCGYARVKYLKSKKILMYMAKNNTVVIGTLGGMMVLGGSLWTIALAILQKPSYMGFIGAGVLIVAGGLLVAFALQGEK